MSTSSLSCRRGWRPGPPQSAQPPCAWQPAGSCAALWLAACAAVTPAQGADLGTIGGIALRWDNSVRETLDFRTDPAQSGVLANINGDDGDRAFRPGLVGARLDLFTDITGTSGNAGFDLSAQGWFDPVYFQGTANRSPRTYNNYATSPTQFPRATRTLLGADAELVDAYVRDRWDIGGTPVSFSLGRQTLLWGESLFFSQNGIAAGQAPVDGIKAAGTPLATARELFLPVTQAVLRVALRPGLALETYDQFEWRRDRLPGVASYFSTVDFLDAGGNRVLVPGGAGLYRVPDAVPHGVGQFGAALRLQGAGGDYGLYALRYDAKSPTPVFDSRDGTYRALFPRGILAFGASASTYLGDSNIAGEVSLRQHMPLAAGSAGLTASAGGTAPGIYGAAAYRLPPAAMLPSPGGFATGTTWHTQLSIVAQLPAGRWWQGASLSAEIAANGLIGVTGGHPYVLAGRTHDAASLRAVFTPSYYQLLPGVDVTVPLGLGITPLGRSSIDASENAGTGSATAGVTATIHAVWQASLQVTRYIGSQPLADRSFASFSVARSW